jgi:hypothetical protein
VIDPYTQTEFEKDIIFGKIGEDIFTKDFLELLDIKYIDVTKSQGFQIIDNDFVSKIGLYEVKTNYKDNKEIIIEEYTNINENLGKINYGWFYKSKADIIVFVSKKTRSMILLPFSQKFKDHYETIKNNHELFRNKISIRNKNKWQSAFRKIPLSEINGYFAFYKKI